MFNHYNPSIIMSVAMICLIIFGNHYARDSVGALEKQLESGMGISTEGYATMNTLYFAPNIFMPLLASLATENSKDISRYGSKAGKMLLGSIFLASIGNILFSVGIQLNNTSSMYIGRFIAGTVCYWLHMRYVYTH
jgi:hypothetical protein